MCGSGCLSEHDRPRTRGRSVLRGSFDESHLHRFVQRALRLHAIFARRRDTRQNPAQFPPPAFHREEAVLDAVAAACLIYQTAVVQGQSQFMGRGSFADLAVQHVRAARHVGGGQGNGSRRDVDVGPETPWLRGRSLTSVSINRCGRDSRESPCPAGTCRCQTLPASGSTLPAG
jgi:hypothetical protein